MRTPGYGITPDRFVRVAHLLPRQCGNVAVDNHTFVNALLWMCRTGAPWRDLPECYGKWVTVYQRFDRWSGNGATGCLSTALQEERIIGVEIRVCFVKLGSAFCAVFFRSVGSGFSAGCAVSAAACLRCVVVVLLVYLVMRACSLR